MLWLANYPPLKARLRAVASSAPKSAKSCGGNCANSSTSQHPRRGHAQGTNSVLRAPSWCATGACFDADLVHNGLLRIDNKNIAHGRVTCFHLGSFATTTLALQPSDHLGRFELRKLLGQGAQSAGRARVMDFGIAARIRQSGPADPALPTNGTLGYLAPEAASGAAPSASMDIFSAGVVLAELILGKPLLNEPDPYRALYRLAHEQLSLPAELHADADDSLRAIVNRALARDPLQRFESAKSFLQALERWTKPTTPVSPSDGDGASNSTLDFLLRRMRHKSDFPAMSASCCWSICKTRGTPPSSRKSFCAP